MRARPPLRTSGLDRASTNILALCLVGAAVGCGGASRAAPTSPSARAPIPASEGPASGAAEWTRVESSEAGLSVLLPAGAVAREEEVEGARLHAWRAERHDTVFMVAAYALKKRAREDHARKEIVGFFKGCGGELQALDKLDDGGRRGLRAVGTCEGGAAAFAEIQVVEGLRVIQLFAIVQEPDAADEDDVKRFFTSLRLLDAQAPPGR